MPIIGVILPFIIISMDEGNEGLVILAFTFIPPLCCVLGLIFAIAALVRGEQNRILPVIGLLVFVAAVAWVVWLVSFGGRIGPSHF